MLFIVLLDIVASALVPILVVSSKSLCASFLASVILASLRYANGAVVVCTKPDKAPPAIPPTIPAFTPSLSNISDQKSLSPLNIPPF